MKKRKLIDRIKNVANNVENIGEGALNHMNFHNLDKELQDAILERRAICAMCPYMSTNAEKDGWYKSARPDEHCTLCDCNISWKTAAPDSECGAAIYNAEQNENLEVKWGKIEK